MIARQTLSSHQVFLCAHRDGPWESLTASFGVIVVTVSFGLASTILPLTKRVQKGLHILQTPALIKYPKTQNNHNMHVIAILHRDASGAAPKLGRTHHFSRGLWGPLLALD